MYLSNFGGVMMQWDAIGALAELLGAIGVIATLLYLGRQIRLTGMAQRASTQHEVLGAFRTQADQLISNEGLARAFQQFVRREQVDDEYRYQLVVYISNVFRTYEELYLAHRDGTVGPDLWESRLRTLRNFYLTREVTQRWWQSVRIDNFYSQPFVELVEELSRQLNRDSGSL